MSSPTDKPTESEPSDEGRFWGLEGRPRPSRKLPGRASWAAPLVLQQKPGTQHFFFRKT